MLAIRIKRIQLCHSNGNSYIDRQLDMFGNTIGINLWYFLPRTIKNPAHVSLQIDCNNIARIATQNNGIAFAFVESEHAMPAALILPNSFANNRENKPIGPSLECYFSNNSCCSSNVSKNPNKFFEALLSGKPHDAIKAAKVQSGDKMVLIAPNSRLVSTNLLKSLYRELRLGKISIDEFVSAIRGSHIILGFVDKPEGCNNTDMLMEQVSEYGVASGSSWGEVIHGG